MLSKEAMDGRVWIRIGYYVDVVRVGGHRGDEWYWNVGLDYLLCWMKWWCLVMVQMEDMVSCGVGVR